MATAPLHPPDFRLVDLRELRGNDLNAVLDEQIRFWRENYLWDFSASAETIKRYLDMRNLPGYAVVWSGRPVGYSYFVHEDVKALIGELYVLEEFRDNASEGQLFEATLKSAALFPGVRRIEGQLLSLDSMPNLPTVFGNSIRVFRRCFMLREGLEHLPPPVVTPWTVRFSRWSDYHIDSAADLVAAAYAGHVDSHINDQYRTFTGARRFLFTSTQHPGCGRFLRHAAIVAGDLRTSKLRGICLGSLVESDIGHVTQVCVDPKLRGQGLGYELLRRSLSAFRDAGSRAVSLTVTEENTGAVQLYERMGFRSARKFPAFVWESN